MLNRIIPGMIEHAAVLILYSAISGKKIENSFIKNFILMLLADINACIWVVVDLGIVSKFLMVAFMFVGLWVIYKQPVTALILYFAVSYILLAVLEVVFWFPFYIFCPEMVQRPVVGVVSTGGALLVALIFHVKKIIRWDTVRDFINTKHRLICYVLAVSGVIITAFVLYLDFGEILMLGKIFLFMLIILAVTFPLLFLYMRKEIELKERSKYEKPILDILARIRQQQHQYDNQVNAIYGLLRSCKTYDELVHNMNGYLESVEGIDPCYDLFTEIENPLLSGFLGVKFSQAQNMGVEVLHEISVKNICSKISIPKLIGIIGNIFDNAIEEVTESALPKIVKLNIYEDSGWYIIHMSNPCREIKPGEMEEFLKKGFSTKGGEDQRGLGLYSVADTVNRYHGKVILDMEKEDGINWFSIIIKIKSSNE